MERKNCAVCGRTIEWRKKWRLNWEQVRFCSDRCRREKNRPTPDYEDRLLEMLRSRPRGATACPSEILPPDLKVDHSEMERVRQAARRLVQSGRIEILQKGRVVDPSLFRGPIRLRLTNPVQ